MVSCAIRVCSYPARLPITPCCQLCPCQSSLLTGLSHFIAEEQLLHTLSTYTGMVIPGYAAILAEQVQVFLEHRQAVGIIGFLAMLFFSSMAFGVLQSAMSVIFFHPCQNSAVATSSFPLSFLMCMSFQSGWV